MLSLIDDGTGGMSMYQKSLCMLAGLPMAIAAFPAYAQTYSNHPHMWSGGLSMIFGPLMMIVFIGAIVIVVVLLIRWFSGAPIGPTAAITRNAPVDILKERFARGEIDQKEFEERKKLLSE
jgi:putative membrane protein